MKNFWPFLSLSFSLLGLVVSEILQADNQSAPSYPPEDNFYYCREYFLEPSMERNLERYLCYPLEEAPNRNQMLPVLNLVIDALEDNLVPSGFFGAYLVPIFDGP